MEATIIEGDPTNRLDSTGEKSDMEALITIPAPEVDLAISLYPDFWSRLLGHTKGYPERRTQESNINRYHRWADENGVGNWEPDLKGYRDWLSSLLKPEIDGETSEETGKTVARFTPETINGYLTTVRSAYRSLINSREASAEFLAMAKSHHESIGVAAGLADDKAYRDLKIDWIEKGIAAKDTKAETVKDQEVADSDHIRLTPAEASSFISAPKREHGDSIKALRDAAIIATLLASGVRAAELCDLEVNDLRQELGGELSLRVKIGKGKKQRLIPWGDLAPVVLPMIESWLDAAGIESGLVFRGFFRGSEVRGDGLTTTAIAQILAQYPVTLTKSGKAPHVRPHDCRRSYARLQFDAGMPTHCIKENLGHKSEATTLKYIGPMKIAERRARSVFLL